MAEIPLLEPLVLRGVVEKFTTPQNLTLLSSVPRSPHPFPTASWEVIRGSRNIARPNVPNSEAHIVPRLGRAQQSAAFIYLREKKVFEPTTLHWLRQVAADNLNDLAKTNAEAAVMREVQDLNQRFDNFAEYCLWQALTGTLTLDFPDVQAEVDYKFLSSHKPSPGTAWDTATPEQIVADVRGWKRLVQRDGRVAATTAYTTDETMDYIYEAFASNGSYLSDRQKDEYFRTGTLTGFLGLNWYSQENVYDATAAAYTAAGSSPSTETKFLKDGAIVLGNFTENRPIELLEGPTADDSAPKNFVGKFAKTWKEQDPSARQYLLEWNILPVITRPEQIVYVDNVLATS